MHDVVHDDELGVEPGRAIFIDFDTAGQQPFVGEARRGNCRIIVGLGGSDHAGAAALRHGLCASAFPGRREIGRDHLDVPAVH